MKHTPNFNKMVGGHFDIKKLFSEGRTFSKAGNLLCGKPFPYSNNIRFVNNILWSEDFNGADDDELNAMPSMNDTIKIHKCNQLNSLPDLCSKVL